MLQWEQSIGVGGVASHVTARAVGAKPTIPPTKAVANTINLAERMRKLRRLVMGGQGTAWPAIGRLTLEIWLSSSEDRCWCS
jgi:hypothetical protein